MEEQAAEQDPFIGAQIGNYLVKAKLGEGGMGAVYLAEHPLIGKRVALKVLHSEFASNQDVVTRFFNEAKAVNDIGHPNIVDIIDYGVIADPKGGRDMVYFIMEFLNGHSLSDVIKEQAPLPPERALAISMQVADALMASHRARIVHRDLKPDNIILVHRRSSPDFVKLLDFGIAKLTGDQPGSHRTRTGIVMGTPAYMSPEQCEGKGRIDHRTDVYALGVVLFEMLTGQVPFLGEGYGEVLVQHLTQPPVRPSTIRSAIPAHVEFVCLKALEKSPDRRYQSMQDFIAALADPVGFVEANGGLDNFMAANLGSPVIPTTPPPGLRAPTDIGMAHTGMSQPMYTPAPGSLSPAAAAPTQYPAAMAKSKLPIFAGVGLLVVGGAVVAALALGGGDDDKKTAAVDGPKVETEAQPVEPVKPAVDKPVVEEPPPVTPDQKMPEPVLVPVKIVNKSGGTVTVGDKSYGRGRELSFDVKQSELPLTVTITKDGYEEATRTLAVGIKSFGDEIELKKIRNSSSTAKRTEKGSSKTSKGTGSTKKSGDNYEKPDWLNN